MLGQVDTRSVLITGGAGFLGARLTRRLAAASADVHLIVRPKSNLWRIRGLLGRLHLHTCDLADLDAVAAVVRGIGPRTVFHLAATGAYGLNDEAQLFRDNVLATSNLLHATSGLPGCRLVHTASSLETGPMPTAIRETDPMAPRVPYGTAKAASTLLARLASAEVGRSIVMLRPFAVYGPGEPDRRLIPSAIRAALTGVPLRLTAPGYTRDLVFVDDVVDAFLLAATADGVDGQLINVATGRATANEEVVRLIEHCVGRPIAIDEEEYPARATDTVCWCADVSKARQLLGWQARHDLEQGLAKTVAEHTVPVDG
jgi:nucleoside-diphosphate-sugar epimerase